MSAVSRKIAAWKRKRAPRPQRIDSIARDMTERQFARESKINKPKKPFVRKDMPENPRVRYMVAYDLETTRIKVGTPKPLYITAYSDRFSYSGPVTTIEQLALILINNFLTVENKGFRYVAWNGNRFDVFFIAAALLHRPEYTLRPYMTRTKNLRGLKVILGNPNDKKSPSWEFLDGMSMIGSLKPLKDFLKTFAPDYQKLDAPDWEYEEFNPKNKKHIEYAERDSEGLWHAMMKAQDIIIDNFNIGLKPTIGNMGIRIFQSFIPMGKSCYEPPFSALTAIRDYAMRGGFCYCVRKFQGKIWKYDLNQAYAAAMRDTHLPAGRCYQLSKPSPYIRCSVYRITAKAPKNNLVPFYYRDLETGRSCFGFDGINDTWITSNEYAQLKKEGWKITVTDGYGWEDSFKMKKYVDMLESLRVPAPKSAQGEMIKAVGNNSYGKTVERLEGIELVMAKECPDGYYSYQAEDDLFQHVWFKFNEVQKRDYHQPQIGAFITAHVRMVVRRAALQAPKAWLYADTDCVVFSEAVELDVHPTTYGKWKQESDGEVFRFIAKKVYADMEAKEKHAKGLNIKSLTREHFEQWFNATCAAEVPEQTQIQRNNFVRVMTGGDMFLERVRRGTFVESMTA